jgi:hypothetical protein
MEQWYHASGNYDMRVFLFTPGLWSLPFTYNAAWQDSSPSCNERLHADLIRRMDARRPSGRFSAPPEIALLDHTPDGKFLGDLPIPNIIDR